jgi:hypothetical protein
MSASNCSILEDPDPQVQEMAQRIWECIPRGGQKRAWKLSDLSKILGDFWVTDPKTVSNNQDLRSMDESVFTEFSC